MTANERQMEESTSSVSGMTGAPGMTTEYIIEITYGDRETKFRNFISSLLIKCCLPLELIKDILEDSELFEKYCSVFTHKSADKESNYEFYELLGDQTMNKLILWYLKDRFPYLSNSNGVKVLSRLKINLVSKQSYSLWAKSLGFMEFISCDKEIVRKHESSLLEDCLEAFCGLTEEIIDHKIRGYSGVYFIAKLLEDLLDNQRISLKYSELYDSITRLKETFDKFNSNLNKGSCPFIWGQISFQHEKDKDTGLFTVKLVQSNPSERRKEVLLSKDGSSINDLKYSIAEEYLNFLHYKGFKKDELSYYEEIEEMRIKNEER